MVALGALYQFVPVVLDAGIFSERLGKLQLFCAPSLWPSGKRARRRLWAIQPERPSACSSAERSA